MSADDKKNGCLNNAISRRTHGLTLGKFAPLHRGHQFMIETALQEMDQVTVIIYDTDVIPIPLPVRAGWLRTLYPQIRVIAAWDGPIGTDYDPEYERAEELYVSSLVAAGDPVTHFYCSEYYGAHMAAALNAVDRRVDPARCAVHISGTQIRINAFAHRQYLDPLVYRDLITKVVFLGAMSTGKSTLTEALAAKYHTSFASEYGRDYWTEHQTDRRISFGAFDEICAGHLAREETAFLQANRYCFVDTNAITTYMFSLDYHGKATPYLTQTALENASRYDLFFLCEDDIPYDDTWDRSGDQKRHIFHQQIIADLYQRRIPFIRLRGSLEERITQVDKVLSEYSPWSNYFGCKA